MQSKTYDGEASNFKHTVETHEYASANKRARLPIRDTRDVTYFNFGGGTIGVHTQTRERTCPCSSLEVFAFQSTIHRLCSLLYEVDGDFSSESNAGKV